MSELTAVAVILSAINIVLIVWIAGLENKIEDLRRDLESLDHDLRG